MHYLPEMPSPIRNDEFDPLGVDVGNNDWMFDLPLGPIKPDPREKLFTEVLELYIHSRKYRLNRPNRIVDSQEELENAFSLRHFFQEFVLPVLMRDYIEIDQIDQGRLVSMLGMLLGYFDSMIEDSTGYIFIKEFELPSFEEFKNHSLFMVEWSSDSLGLISIKVVPFHLD